mmetsp:Transcript_5735/g.17027  ORF Transcript_5735/g.17027 Transcript_5735/m.17027 type:complete len:125 (+) Transcript_5735:2521-2895(+)
MQMMPRQFQLQTQKKSSLDNKDGSDSKDDNHIKKNNPSIGNQRGNHHRSIDKKGAHLETQHGDDMYAAFDSTMVRIKNRNKDQTNTIEQRTCTREGEATYGMATFINDNTTQHNTHAKNKINNK